MRAKQRYASVNRAIPVITISDDCASPRFIAIIFLALQIFIPFHLNEIRFYRKEFNNEKKEKIHTHTQRPRMSAAPFKSSLNCTFQVTNRNIHSGWCWHIFSRRVARATINFQKCYVSKIWNATTQAVAEMNAFSFIRSIWHPLYTLTL